MKILHIIDTLGLGGAQTVVQGIFNGEKENKDIHLFALREKEVRTEIQHENVTVFQSKNDKKDEKITVVSAGRLIPRKGYEYLIRALEGKKNFEVVLIGDGPLTEELSDLADELGVNVSFLGKVKHERVASIFQDSDIFALPSLNEGMSNAILEAMACGLPIIATDTGGSKELVKENGFLVEKYSSEDLKNTLEKFEKEKDLILKKGNISRKMAEKMKWGNIAREYYKYYD